MFDVHSFIYLYSIYLGICLSVFVFICLFMPHRSAYSIHIFFLPALKWCPSYDHFLSKLFMYAHILMSICPTTYLLYLCFLFSLFDSVRVLCFCSSFLMTIICRAQSVFIVMFYVCVVSENAFICQSTPIKNVKEHRASLFVYST